MSFLIDEDKERFSAFPIQTNEKKFYESYLSQRAAYWIETEIDAELEKDIKEWRDNPKITPEIKLTVNRVVGGFSVTDGVTNQILGESLQPGITNRIYQVLTNFIKFIEDIHNITYSKLAEVYLLPGQTFESLSREIATNPLINKRIEWLLSSVGLSMETKDYNSYRNLPRDQKKSLINLLETKQNKTDVDLKILEVLKLDSIDPARAVLLNGFNEGVGFTSSFCIVFWLKDMSLLKGLVKANELISRDENMHKEVSIMTYKALVGNNPIPEEEVHKIFREGLEIEREFVRYLLPNKLLGLNSDMMIEYVEFIADRLLVDLGYSPLYGDRKCPFSFINLQSSGVRSTDFFADTAVSEYNEEKRGHNSINIDKYLEMD
jgi:ribonucleoside-diphosphate reductase beta chain